MTNPTTVAEQYIAMWNGTDAERRRAHAAEATLFAGVDDALLGPPVNALRLALPKGLAPRTVNLAEWRAHLLERLRREIALAADAGLAALMAGLRSYPAPPTSRRPKDLGGVAVPFQLRTSDGVLSFFSTTMVFGTPIDVTLSELALETFLPADSETAAALQRPGGR